jgi:hypothetical protein
MVEEYARHEGHADLLRERINATADDQFCTDPTPELAVSIPDHNESLLFVK